MSRRFRPQQPTADAGTTILGDEQAAELFSRLEALTAQVVALEDQMRSQYTSVATYAAIASEQVEFARGEARADLDRTRDMLVGLLEQVRNEFLRPGDRAAAVPTGRTLPTPVAVVSDQNRILRRLDQLEHSMDVCFDRQRDLAETVAAVFDTITAGSVNQPIVDLALI